MKKPFVILTALLVCLMVGVVAVWFQPERGDVSRVETDFRESQFFTGREMEQAAQAVKKEFQKTFPQYSLDKIQYISDLRQLENDQDAEYDGRNIIFYTDFVRKEAAPNADEPEQYARYRWCVAELENGRWSVVEHGF